MHDALPLDFGPLEIDQQRDASAGGSQIIKALRNVFVGELFHAFELDYQLNESKNRGLSAFIGG